MKYYQTKTQEDYDDLMGILEQQGYTWASGKLPTEYKIWDKYGKDTTLSIYEEKKVIGSFCEKKFHIIEGISEKDIIVWSNSKLNNPTHYKINGKDSMKLILDIVKENSTSVEETIYLFNTLKYLIRYKRKNGKEDLLKAKDYLERLINEEEREKEKSNV